MSRRTSGGVALVGVLWLLVLLTAIAMALTTTVRSEVQTVSNTLEITRARYAAQGGVELGVWNLLLPKARRWPVDGSAHEVRIQDVALRIMTMDEAGKIDINHAGADVLAALFMQSGADPGRAAALADAVLDWRDGDDMRHLNGAEDEDYRAAGREYAAADRNFQTVGELRFVLGMDDELFARIRPAVTVCSGLPGVNASLASPQVVAAVSGIEHAQTNASGLSYTIYVDARTEAGARLAVAATLLLAPGGDGKPYQLVAWREAPAELRASAAMAGPAGESAGEGRP